MCHLRLIGAKELMRSNMSVADTDSEIKADPEKRRADGNK
jgi:hypothetical protein